MRYLMTISYDGSKYYGFQRLNNKDSVQKEIEKALTKLAKEKVLVKGAGRTDRGVHAYAQKIHFALNINITPERLVNATNSLLSNYIRVLNCKIVSDDFHARHNVVEKTYKYIINMGVSNPIKEDYVYNYGYKLDIKSMKKASKYLIGKHSYRVFVSGERENYNSELFNIKFDVKKNYLTITFIGTSFYRYMVRNMVGALMLVGRGKISIEEFKNMVDSEDNSYTFMTVPANGLYLCDIKY